MGIAHRNTAYCGGRCPPYENQTVGLVSWKVSVEVYGGAERSFDMVSPMNGASVASLSRLVQANAKAIPQTAADGLDFQQLLMQSLQDVAAMQQNAELGIQESLVQGDMTNVEVLASVKKADLALRLMLQVRNKELDAYKEIKEMRM